MSTIFGLDSTLVIVIVGAVVSVIGCSVGIYYFLTRCFSLHRRAIVRKHLPVDVIIVEKVEEEVKVDPGPPRELTRRELKKLREREREQKSRGATAETGTNSESGSPERGGTASSSHTAGGGISSLFSCFGGKKDVAADGESDRGDRSHSPIPFLYDLEAGDSVIAGFDIQVTNFGDDDVGEGGDGKKKKKKKKKEQKEEAELSAMEEGISEVEKEAAIDEDENKGKVEGSKSSKKAHEAVANREARRQKIREAEEKRASEEAYEKFLQEETPEQRQARLDMEKRDKMDKEEKRRHAQELKRQHSLRDSLLIMFGQRRSDAVVAPQLHSSPKKKLDPSSVSLFDVDVGSKGRQIVERRLEQRMDQKLEIIEDGDSDVVTRNSGPPFVDIPEGKLMVQTIPELTLARLQHQRIMVYFDEGRSKGWFLGTVSGLTKRPACNFTVKFDKAETASIDIDGIISCALDCSGEYAYGYHWVLLEDDPNYVPRKGTPGKSRPVSRAL